MKLTDILKKIIPITILMIIVLAATIKTCENDLFFDLATGESILKNGVDFKDHFSFIPNLTYIYHHWLYDVIILFIFKLSGYKGLLLLFYFFFLFTAMLLFHINKKNTKSTFLGLVVTLYTVLSCNGFFVSRVQTITYFLFILELFFLEKLYTSGNKKYLFFLSLISILIANIHMPLWIFTIILTLPYLVEVISYWVLEKFKILKNFFNNKVSIDPPKNTKLFILTIIILLFTGLLSPLRHYPYTFFMKSLFNDNFAFISEMKPTYLIIIKYELILIIIFVISEYFKLLKIKFRDFLLIIGLFIFSLIAFRNVIYFLLIAPTIYIKCLCDGINHIRLDKFKNKLLSINKKINMNVISIFTFACLVVFLVYVVKNTFYSSFQYGLEDEYPVKAVQYIKDNLDYKEIKLYNDFNYGSYIEFNDVPVFIDSRAEVYIAEFNGGNDIVTDYQKANEYITYKEVFDKYDFDYALVYLGSDLNYFLSKDSEYCVIFQDNGYVLYEKFRDINTFNQRKYNKK